MTQSCVECGRFLEVPCEYLGRFCKFTVKVAKRKGEKQA